VVRPGSPLRDLLHVVRRRAEPNGATYQFVRRYALEPHGDAPSAPEPAPARFATVVVLADADAAALVRGDLAEQSYVDFDIVEVASLVEVGDAMARAAGRYVCLVTTGERLSPGWMAALVDAAEPDDARGRVLCVEVGAVEADQLRSLVSEEVPALAEQSDELAVESFDALAADPAGAVVPAAFAIPGELVRTHGLRPLAEDGDAAVTAFLARCVQVAGLVPVPDRVVLSSGPTAPGFLSDGVVEALDGEPYLLPAGSAARLLGRRDLAASARSTEQHLQGELASTLAHARGIEAKRDERVVALTAQLQRMEEQQDELMATVARMRGERSTRWLHRLRAKLAALVRGTP
jgi:hypothetical protein